MLSFRMRSHTIRNETKQEGRQYNRTYTMVCIVVSKACGQTFTHLLVTIDTDHGPLRHAVMKGREFYVLFFKISPVLGK